MGCGLRKLWRYRAIVSRGDVRSFVPRLSPPPVLQKRSKTEDEEGLGTRLERTIERSRDIVSQLDGGVLPAPPTSAALHVRACRQYSRRGDVTLA